jgi:hypothetical protein
MPEKIVKFKVPEMSLKAMASYLDGRRREEVVIEFNGDELEFKITRTAGVVRWSRKAYNAERVKLVRRSVC